MPKDLLFYIAGNNRYTIPILQTTVIVKAFYLVSFTQIKNPAFAISVTEVLIFVLWPFVRLRNDFKQFSTLPSVSLAKTNKKSLLLSLEMEYNNPHELYSIYIVIYRDI